MHLLFDLDGTLTDPYQGITRCITHALTSLGRKSPPPMDLGWCIGPPLKTSFAKLLNSDDEGLAGRALEIYRDRFGKIGIFENTVYPGIPETLETLEAAGHILYVATSKPAVYADRIIDHFNLQKYFRAIYGSELDGRRSDKTSLLAYILEKEPIDSTQTIMIGDRKHDITGAKANNIRALGVLWGYGTKEELILSGAHCCLSKPEELISLLGTDSGKW